MTTVAPGRRAPAPARSRGRGPRRARPGSATGGPRRTLAELLRGDRVLVLVLVGAVALGLVVVIGPLENHLAARARLEALERKAAALEAENSRLERRAEDLSDPATIELLAREEQGFVRPGEVPYVLTPPPVDRPRIVAAPEAAPAAREDVWTWLLRVVRRVRGSGG